MKTQRSNSILHAQFGLRTVITLLVAFSFQHLTNDGYAQVSYATNNEQPIHLGAISFDQYTYNLSGKVTDPDGEGVPGVAVYVESKSKGTVTDISGLYELRDLILGDVISFSSIGYETQKFSINERMIANGGQKINLDVLMVYDVLEISGALASGQFYHQNHSGTRKLWNKIRAVF